jgi:imidazolonepropionase-like amidohydrolase
MRAPSILAFVSAVALLWSGALLASAPRASAAASASAAEPGPRTLALRFARVVTESGPVIEDAVVIVEGDKIRAVGPASRTPLPAGAKEIDLSRYTGVPGLIDVHTHLTYAWDGTPGTNPWQQLSARPTAATVYLAAGNAKRTLEAGVTTVRDLGSWDYMDVAMRDLIASGAMTGPRMFVCGYGLHPTVQPTRPGYEEPPGGNADGAAEVMRVVRQNIAAGADVIKIYGSTGSADDVTGDETYTYEEMKAAVDAAKGRGRRVAVHSYGPDGARDAVRAGATSIEHATDMDDATLREMAKRGTFYVPTVDHNRYYAENASLFGYDSAAVSRLNEYRGRNLETLRRAVRAKVKVAMGSDALFTMCGENARELEWFVKAGMTPAQALTAATVNGAALLGKERELGALAPGYMADILAVEGNPLTDIQAVIARVRWVMKAGQVVVDRRMGTAER